MSVKFPSSVKESIVLMLPIRLTVASSLLPVTLMGDDFLTGRWESPRDDGEVLSVGVGIGMPLGRAAPGSEGGGDRGGVAGVITKPLLGPAPPVPCVLPLR